MSREEGRIYTEEDAYSTLEGLNKRHLEGVADD